MESSLQRLNRLNSSLRSCTTCRLHKYRRVPLLGTGNKTDPLFVILLDRPSVSAARTGELLKGVEGGILLELLSFVKMDLGSKVGSIVEMMYVTTITGCPTGIVLNEEKRQQEVLSSPKVPAIKACGGFKAEEVRILDPEFIVTVGAQALRSLYTKPPALDSAFGRLIQARLQGEFSKYDMPVCAIPTLLELYRDSLKEGRQFLRAVNILGTTIETAVELRKMRGEQWTH